MSRHMTTISMNLLETVSGGVARGESVLLPIRSAQTDTKAAIVGGNVIAHRERNSSCNGAICGGERLQLFLQ